MNEFFSSFTRESYEDGEVANALVEDFADLNEHDSEIHHLSSACSQALISASELVEANEIILDQEINSAITPLAAPVLEKYLSKINASIERLGLEGISFCGFTGENAQKREITFARESLVEKAKEIYYRVMALMKRIAQKFILWVTSFMYSTKRVIKLAEYVKKLADERMDEKDFSDKKVKLSKREIRWLVKKNGKAVDAANLASDYRKINMAENEVGSLIDFIIEQFEAREFETVVGNETLITGRTTEFKDVFKARFTALSKVKSVDYPFGSSKLEINVKPETMHCSIAIVKSPFEPKELDVPVMSPADAKAVAETAISAVERYKDDKPVKEIEKNMAEFIKALDKFVKNHNAHSNTEMAKIVTGLQGIGILGITAYRANRNYMLQLHHAVLVYAEQSLLRIRAKKN